MYQPKLLDGGECVTVQAKVFFSNLWLSDSVSN